MSVLLDSGFRRNDGEKLLAGNVSGTRSVHLRPIPPNKKETLWCDVSFGFASFNDAANLIKMSKSDTHAGCESGMRGVTSLSLSL